MTYTDLDRGRWSPLLCLLYSVEAESRLFTFLQQPFEYLLPLTHSFFCLRLKDSSLHSLFLQITFSKLMSILVALLQAVPTSINVLKMQKYVPAMAWQILQDVFIELFAFFATYRTPVCLLIQCNLQALSVFFPPSCFYCWLFKFMYNFVLDSAERILNFTKVTSFLIPLSNIFAVFPNFMSSQIFMCTLYSITQGCKQKH